MFGYDEGNGGKRGMTESEISKRITTKYKKMTRVRRYARLLSFVVGIVAFSIILTFDYENVVDPNPLYRLMIAGILVIGIAFVVTVILSLIINYLTKRELAHETEEWDVSLD